MQPPRLPKKKEVALQLLEQATVFVHLDPRADAVRVPPWFKRQPQLVLQVGLNMAVPIPDLQVDDDGLSCTLSFNRSPFLCVIPWDSVFALVGENRQGMIWPDDVPPEVQAQAAAQQAKQVPAKPELRIAPAPAEEPAPVASIASAKKERAAASKGAKPAAKTAASKNAKTTRAASGSAKTAKSDAASKSATPSRTAAAKAVVGKSATAKTAASKATAAKPAAKQVAAKPAAVAKPAAAKPAALKEQAPAAKPAAAAKPAPVAAPALKAPVQRAVPAAAQPAAAAGGASKRKLPPYLRIVK